MRCEVGSTRGAASAVAVGMAGQGYDLQLTSYDERGWRATFYTTGMEHSGVRLGADTMACGSGGGA